MENANRGCDPQSSEESKLDDPRFTVGLELGTNVGAGRNCHPTGSEYHRSTRVPLTSCLAKGGQLHAFEYQFFRCFG